MTPLRTGLCGLLAFSLLLSSLGLPAQALAEVASQAVAQPGQAPAGVGQVGAAPGSLSPVSGSLSQPLNGLSLTATLPGVNGSLSLPKSASLSAPESAPAAAAVSKSLPSAVSPSVQSAPAAASVSQSLPSAVSPAVSKPAAAAVSPAVSKSPAQEQQSAVPAVGPAHAVAAESARPQSPASAREQSPSSLRKFAAGLNARLSRPFGAQPDEAAARLAEGKARPAAAALARPDDPQLPPGTPKSLAEVDLEPEPGRKYYASPEDWADEIFYSILVDRFARSPEGRAWGDPKDGGTRHGGDLKGIIAQLDYIKESGVTAIHLSPVVVNVPEAYHGYAPVNNLAIDPHMGTMEDFETLVSEAHKRGIRIMLDIVINHVGPVFDYENEHSGGHHWVGMDKPAKKIDKWTYPLAPSELAKPEHFTRHGVIENWNDHDQAIYGDFPPNYRHYASERPETQGLLIDMVKFWLKKDIDGIRLDAIRHINPSFTPRMVKELKEYAARLGKKNFLFLGENSTGVDGEILPFMGPNGINSAYNYPAYRRDNYALHGKAPTRALEDSVNATVGTFGSLAKMLMRFIDNHDTYRFLREGEPLSLLRVAFGFLLFSIGIPVVLYGTEQAFRQSHGRLDPEGPVLPADPENRPDMFKDGQFKFPSSQGDKFDRASESYRLLRRLADVRKDYPALRRGAQYIRWSDPWGAGIFAFSRIYQGQEVLVVLNTANEPRSAEMWVDGNLTPAGTPLKDALDPGFGSSSRAAPGGGSKVKVDVPAHGVRVLVRRSQ